MTLVALLRHGPTAWNKARRLQGRTDIPLLPETRAELGRRRLPTEVAGFRALCSPMGRCRETAALLGLDPAIDERLIAMRWGTYEGRTFADLHKEHGPAFADNEARGLDFRPPDGESPREVQARVAGLLREIAGERRPTIAVTHREVLRAVYAQAIDWNMTGEPPHEFDLYALQIFRLDDSGKPAIERLNVSLDGS